MAEPGAAAAAFYARRGGRAADWWTLLHPPYTVWHLSYVVLGAAMAPEVDLAALGISVLAFFLAVGLAAHALDELQGRPLHTDISDRTLRGVAAFALAGACVLGVVGVFFWGPVNWPLAIAIPVGAVLVVGYNLELFGGRLHTDWAFAWGWGGFPVAVGFVAQSPDLTWTLAGRRRRGDPCGRRHVVRTAPPQYAGPRAAPTYRRCHRHHHAARRECRSTRPHRAARAARAGASRAVLGGSRHRRGNAARTPLTTGPDTEPRRCAPAAATADVSSRTIASAVAAPGR